MSDRYTGTERVIQPAPDPGVVSLTSTFLKRVSRILDAGCGNGRNAIHLAKEGHDVVGIDTDPTMIEETRTLARAVGSSALHLNFRNCDMLRLPFPAPSFEAVLATRSLQQLHDRHQTYQALSNIQEVTMPEGLNFVTAYIGTRHEQKSKPHLTIFSPGEIEDFYTTSGWKVIHAYRDSSEPTELDNGTTLLRSYDEIVVQKPAQSAQPLSSLSFTNLLSLEGLKRADPELYGGTQS